MISFPSLIRKLDGAALPFEKAGVLDQVAHLRDELLAAGYGPQLKALTDKHGVTSSIIASAVFIGAVWAATRGASANLRTPPTAGKVAPEKVVESKPPEAKGDTLRVAGQFARFQHASEDYGADDLRTPSANAADEQFRRHYAALLANGKSAEAGKFYARNRDKFL